jgi:F-type H+-transporting ATPase subunit b
MNLILFLAEKGHASDGFMKWWYENADPILNYPGFEAWKFLNLAIFVAVIVHLLRKPLTESFKAKREQVRRELLQALQEREKAQAELVAIEAKLANLEAEKQRVIEEAKLEAEAEKQRLLREAEIEIQKIQRQAENEILRVYKQAEQELRRFSAEETIRLAEQIIRQKMTPQIDANLVKANIKSIGDLN